MDALKKKQQENSISQNKLNNFYFKIQEKIKNLKSNNNTEETNKALNNDIDIIITEDRNLEKNHEELQNQIIKLNQKIGKQENLLRSLLFDQQKTPKDALNPSTSKKTIVITTAKQKKYMARAKADRKPNVMLQKASKSQYKMLPWS